MIVPEACMHAVPANSLALANIEYGDISDPDPGIWPHRKFTGKGNFRPWAPRCMKILPHKVSRPWVTSDRDLVKSKLT